MKKAKKKRILDNKSKLNDDDDNDGDNDGQNSL